MSELVSNVQVYGLENSIRVSKFPMSVDVAECTDEVISRTMKLAQAERGSGHDNFLKGILVQFDLTCTNKMWVEAERYHWFDIVSSQSTMHRISKMKFDECFNEYVDDRIKAILDDIRLDYLDEPTPENYLKLLYNVPSGLKLTAGITTNYQQLKTIYGQRKTHRLPEWREFCKWITTLPHSEFIIGG